MESEKPKPDPKTIRRIVEHSAKPLIFRGLMDSWPLARYSFAEWSDIFGDRLLECRVGRKRAHEKGKPEWERHCDSIRCTFAELLKWTRSEHGSDERFKGYRPNDHFLYFDYKYIKDIFDPDVIRMIDWSTAGYTGRGGAESTFWLGTEGAHTPCHYDTYGCNLVGQIAGCKRWILFPPEDSDLLQATRVPYEESSVYSQWDFRYWTNGVPSIDGTHPHVVELRPGDVLLVPRHWWHFVLNTELSISINTWLERPEDDEARLQEALVKFFMVNVSRNLADPLIPQLLNPNEEETPHIDLEEIQGYINHSIRALRTGQSASDSVDVDLLISDYGDWVKLVDVAKTPEPANKVDVSEDTNLLGIIRAFCDPRVIRTVSQVLRESENH